MHGETERGVQFVLAHLDRFQMFQKRWTGEPVHVPALGRDIVTKAGGHRDCHQAFKVKAAGEGLKILPDFVKALFGVIDEIDLVHRQHHMADAEQRGNEGMAAGLYLQAMAGIDEKHGKIGSRGAGCHVAGVLFVARCVGHDELALVGGKEAVGHINGDALLALCFQPVDQERQIDVFADRAVFLRVPLKGCQLILEDQLGVIEQTADQRRLAVIHRAAGQEPQLVLLLLGRHIGGNSLRTCQRAVLGVFKNAHQKYPSRFFFSIEALSSLSIRRPWRSDVRAISISLTMPGKVVASDSIAPVSG
ncbi:hypothetical protein LAX5112_05031 [Roseibium alexandrii]|uniref:Uncharacterized protein n=1 Tax=Roseibium alexandrii TaxID=388408 RepID=A0A0M7ASV7_9HYPH|nr:hypothetical protein LAX5112_05031 [Roseibium alexandrii]